METTENVPKPKKKPRIMKCLRCGYSWATRLQPKRCANGNCRSDYWNIPRRADLKAEAERKTEQTKPPELSLHEQEVLAYEAKHSAEAAGLSVSDWLSRLLEADREKYATVPNTLEIWQRVERQIAQQNAWWARVEAARKARGINTLLGWGFMCDAERELRAKSIPLDDQRAVDYVFEILPLHMHPNGKETNPHGWLEA